VELSRPILSQRIRVPKLGCNRNRSPGSRLAPLAVVGVARCAPIGSIVNLSASLRCVVGVVGSRVLGIALNSALARDGEMEVLLNGVPLLSAVRPGPAR
jgi:hypothetical protein